MNTNKPTTPKPEHPLDGNPGFANTVNWISKAIEDAQKGDEHLGIVMALGAITEALYGLGVEIRNAATPPADPDTPTQPDPASPTFHTEVTELAAQLWAADPQNTSPARTFNDDYLAAQERYTTMARTLLDPTEDGTR